jgi:hypothetical protein
VDRLKLRFITEASHKGSEDPHPEADKTIDSMAHGDKGQAPKKRG